MAKSAKKKEATPVTRAGRLPCNEARGEVRLFIDDEEIVIVAELGRLAAISSRLQCKSLNDLFLRLSTVEVEATMAGIEFLTVRGNAQRAISKLKLRHFSDCSVAFTAALGHHFDGDRGNVGAGAQPA